MSDWLDAEDYANRALDLYERGCWVEAEAELRKALAIDADQPEWFFQLGLILEASNRDVEALTAFDQAASLAPDQVDAVMGSALANLRLGKLDAAESRLREVIDREPACEEAWARMIEVEARNGRHEDARTTFYLAQYHLDGPSADCLLELGTSLMEQGDLGRAAWCMQESLRLEPDLPGAWQRLADLHVRTGDMPRALELYTGALRDQPTDPITALSYADLLHRYDREAEAADVLRQVLDIDPANAEAHFRLGMMSMRHGQYQQAALALQLVRRLDRDHPWADRALAESLLRLGQTGDARRLLGSIYQRVNDRLAIDAEAEDVEAVDALGRLLLEAGMAGEAARVLTNAVDRGGDVNRLRRLARAYYLSGDLAGGRAASRRVLRFDAGCLDACYNLALALLREGRLGEADGWIRRGLRINRRDEGLRTLRFRLWMAGLVAMLRRVAGVNSRR